MGYAIDRLNAKDGKGMSLLKKEMSIQASEQFEEVNRLEPIYKGEEIILDPYAKITSIWGSLAEAYLNKKQTDSALWAFKEGKKRGGFIEPVLSYNRQLLNNCSENAILITYGDIVTIPIWYLQTVEKYRLDVTVVDANLINTIWYPKYLKSERNLNLSYDKAALDTIEYVQWKTLEINISNEKNKNEKLTWLLKPTYLDNYILKGDRILLDIFKQNFFSRDIYFNSNSDTSYNLYLDKYFIDEGLLDKVSLLSNSNKLENLRKFNIDNLNPHDIIKSITGRQLLEGYRWAYLSMIANLIESNNYRTAKELLNEMTLKFSPEIFPYFSEQEKQYVKQIGDVIDQN